MSALTGFVASVVVQSSAAALSHFGLALEPTHVEKPAPVAEHVVARTHAAAIPQKIADCPELRAKLHLDRTI